MGAQKCIVHPADFSAGAGAAFTHALEVAKRDGAELILAHVLEPVYGFGDETYMARSIDLRDAAETAARREFDRRLAAAKTAGVAASDVLLDGFAPEQIVKLAEERGAELIVMGAHGRTGIRKLLLGSVAQRVVATAPCPVLTVRTR